MQKKRRREEKGEREGEGEKFLTFFKGIVNSLSALVRHIIICCNSNDKGITL